MDTIDIKFEPEYMKLNVTTRSKELVEGTMPVGPHLYQAHGFVHGGITMSFLESLASTGAEEHTDFSKELPFGIEVHIRHRKSAQHGTMHGSARLDRVEGRKQFWNVEARDDEGDIISDGVIVTKVVTLERLKQKAAEREAARNAGER